MKYIDESPLINKTILLRVDLNVPLNNDQIIVSDERIQEVLPTIRCLLKGQNRVILISHLGRPEGKDQRFSLAPVIKRLEELLHDSSIPLVQDFLSEATSVSSALIGHNIIALENIRFYEQEQANDLRFAKALSSLGDAYVNDAFSVCHRTDASVVGIPKFLPSFAGLLLKKELQMLDKLLKDPARPFVAILGGSKISTKIKVLERLFSLADTILVGGGIANSLLLATGNKIGKSIAEPLTESLKTIVTEKRHQAILMLPTDVVVKRTVPTTVVASETQADDTILDIGPKTREEFGKTIQGAKTIIWNGPVGKFEEKPYDRGTDAIYHAIITNNHLTSIIGGGDTLAAIATKPGRDKITHISTAGGAMLDYIAIGTLPGIQALNR